MTTVTQSPDGDVREGGGKRWGLVAAGVGGALMVGGGAFAAVTMLGGGGDRPASVLPGHVAAYVQVDLDPSAGQKVAAVRFFQGLDPEMQERLDAGEWREWVWEQIEEEGEVPSDIRFEEDIEPWLGDRAGFAVLPAGEGEEPVVAVALQVKDGDAALAFLDEQMSDEEDVAYYLESDFVVFSQAHTLDAVKAAASVGTLDDNETYTSDMADLGDAGIVAAWADASKIDDIDPGALNPMLGAGGMGMSGLDGLGGETPEVTGRMAATVRLAPDAIEVHGISRGVEGVAAPETDAARLVNQLPADTAVALSLQGGAGMVQAVWDEYSRTNPEEIQGITEEAAASGFTLPDDLMTVLGDSMSLVVGPDIVEALNSISPTDSAVPAIPVAYRVTTDAQRMQEMMNENGVGAGVLVVREDEGTLTVGADQAYVDALAEGGGNDLGSSDLFTQAVPNPDDAHFVFYVATGAFEQYYLPEVTDEKARTALERLGAVGMSGTNESEGAGSFTLRLVADPQE